MCKLWCVFHIFKHIYMIIYTYYCYVFLIHFLYFWSICQCWCQCHCSVTKVISNFLQPHGLQHTRVLCPTLSPGVYSDSCPLSQWYYLTISSSAAPFSFCLQSFPALWSFPMSQLFTSVGQRTGASASASVLPGLNIQGWFFLGFAGLISFQLKGLSRSSPAPQFKSISSCALSLFYVSIFRFIHDYWKTIALTIQTFVSKVMPLLF